MKTLIIDTLTNEFYAVSCSSNPKGYLSNANDECSPEENDFSYWTDDENEAFDFSSELLANHEMSLNDLTFDNTRNPKVITR